MTGRRSKPAIEDVTTGDHAEPRDIEADRPAGSLGQAQAAGRRTPTPLEVGHEIEVVDGVLGETTWGEPEIDQGVQRPPAEQAATGLAPGPIGGLEEHDAKLTGPCEGEGCGTPSGTSADHDDNTIIPGHHAASTWSSDLRASSRRCRSYATASGPRGDPRPARWDLGPGMVRPGTLRSRDHSGGGQLVERVNDLAELIQDQPEHERHTHRATP